MRPRQHVKGFYLLFECFACRAFGGNTVRMLKRFANWLMQFRGWKVIGDLPDLDKAVFIAAPHTSNWDGFWLMTYKIAFDIDVHFLAKHTLFWWPLGSFMRAMGATPIDR